MTQHRINFAPDSWSHSGHAESRRSIAATGVVAFCLLVFGLWIGGGPAVPEVNALVPSVTAAPTRCRVPIEDELSTSLWRAAHWRPWDEVLLRLSTRLEVGSRLHLVRYDGKDRLEVSGEVMSFAELPPLMLALGEIQWLTEPDPQRAEHNPKTGRIEFELRLKVLSLLNLENEVP